MTYDDYAKQQSDYIPPPPMPAPTPTDLLRSYSDKVGGSRLLRNYSDRIAALPRPPDSMGGLQLGGYGDWPKPGVSLSSIMNPLDYGRRPTSNPSFEPMRGEVPALQMPGLARVGNWLKQETGDNPIPLPGYRDLGRNPATFQPLALPSPPPSLSRDLRAVGNTLIPPGVKFLANQPLAQIPGSIPGAATYNAALWGAAADEANKTDDQRAREQMRPLLDEAAQRALEPLMMRKYAEKMGYIPTPSVWKRIWRSIIDTYTSGTVFATEGGLKRGIPTPAPR